MSVIARLRPEDEAEVRAATGKDPAGAIMRSFVEDGNTQVCVIDGVPQALFGCGEAAADVGIPWMVGTIDFPILAKRQLAVDARRYIEKWQAVYALLFNAVHVDNTHSISWLTRLGFKFLPAQPYGATGQPFIIFYRQRHV